MESVAKRYFWVINLLLLAGLAYLSARVANNFVAEKLVSLEPEKTKAEKKLKADKAIKGLANEWATTIVGRNLFNSDPPEPKEETEGDTDGEKPEEKLDPSKIPGPGEECKDSDAPVNLSATLVADPDQWSMAAVKEEGRDRLVRIGAMLGDHELVAIQRQRIVLAESNKFECVAIGKSKSRPSGRYGSRRNKYKSSSSYSNRKKKKNNSAKVKAGVKKTAKNSYEIDRDMLNEQLEDLGQLSRQARVIPHYRGGKPKGFKLVGVRPGSLYSHIGVRSGDILKSVNGEGITSPTKALELFEKLKTSDGVTLDIERRGRKTTLEYIIK